MFNAPNDVPGPPVQFGPPITPTDVKAGEGFVGNGLPEKDVFYYHPDHLGSTNYVTGITGQITEHIETMAFGEILFEEHSSSFTTPYIFTGLELDRETNLTYASQRYLDMKTSIFVGVDKLAEKYPNFSGYIYAMQNPIRLTDPTGMEPVDERKIDITIPISSGYESNLQKLLNINKIGTAGINPGGDGGDSELNHAMHAGGDYDQEDPPTKAQPKPGEFVSPQMEMNYKINEFALDAVMWVDGAAELSALKWGLAKASVKGWFSFGAKNAMAEGKLANHLFKGTGKLADTAGNRALITKISNGKSLGVDAYGKSWYAKTLGNGTQIYSYTQNGIIKGAGLNQTPVNIIARYGLK
ncbi:RHS repeat domain-containing protein [Flavobacterium psychrophilum]|uniref:RHS repeat domain-containing protein n=1 Tax=Flavobacterium psychrophilum TaxID=96345 RepID=UPI0007C50FC7|nr:RHS repeat-associated core domain-containing protein [Flavobacterium psychrophilum]OAE90434.1 hypothetical protein SU65_11885 [Flavobacterium psychrophilum]